MTEKDRGRKISKELRTAIVQGLLDAQCLTEAQSLASAETEMKFDQICQQYSVECSPAWQVIEQIMFLFYDWADNGDDAQNVQDFVDKYNQHPTELPGVAAFYWQAYGNVLKEWKVLYPELLLRFNREDVKRIPWRVKQGYCVSTGSISWVPVADYGAPLRQRDYKVRSADGSILTFTAYEGQPYAEARKKATDASKGGGMSPMKL